MEKDTPEAWAEYFRLHPTKIDPTMKDHSNDPYFVKKLEWAKDLVEKIKWPADRKIQK